MKNFAGQRAVNSGRGARHTRHFFRTRASQHVKFRQRDSDSTFSVGIKHKQSAHESRNPYGKSHFMGVRFRGGRREAMTPLAKGRISQSESLHMKKVLLDFEQNN
ncbi:MAG: hypothetical protein ONB51_01835 [candidate division KSB1 bacterium]|nr:hypothetical protein [candidate division KSB1 bacterium]MDZ7407959.1 hypothetical protein [candidate division KSB1 bacterium]